MAGAKTAVKTVKSKTDSSVESEKTAKGKAPTKAKAPVKAKPKKEEPVEEEEEEVTEPEEQQEEAPVKKGRKVVTTETLDVSLKEILGMFDATIADFKAKNWKGVQSLRTLKNRVAQFGKDAGRATRSRRRRVTSEDKKTKSYFNRPFPISPELSKVLALDPSSKHSTSELTTYLNKYAVEHKLKDPENGRIIHLDSALQEVFAKGLVELKAAGKPVESNKIYFQHFQSLIKHHLIRETEQTNGHAESDTPATKKTGAGKKK